MVHWKETALKEGKTFITSEKGNSMIPLIKSGQKHKLSPILIDDVIIGDIVFCKVKGNYYTHLVTAIDIIKGCQISNNKGRVNGWTKNIYGKVIEIIE